MPTLFRLLTLGCALMISACTLNTGDNARALPIPSAARGGVQPPATMPEPMRHDVHVAPVKVQPPAKIAMTTPAPEVNAAPTVISNNIHSRAQALPLLDGGGLGGGDGRVGDTPAHISTNGGYVLGTGDEIRLTVYGEDDLSGQYQIGSTGIIALPLVGNVQAAGHTIDQFENAVREKLTQGYLNDPRVSVQVANYRPFFILGEVAKPGSYPYVNGMTVLSAVATAGGYTYRADRGDVRVTHANVPNKAEQDIEETAPIMPGDVLRVTERFF